MDQIRKTKTRVNGQLNTVNMLKTSLNFCITETAPTCRMASTQHLRVLYLPVDIT